MTAQTLAGGQSVVANPWARAAVALGSAPSFANTSAITAAGHKIAWLGRMVNKDRASKQIRFIEARMGSAITKAGGSTLQVSIQGVSLTAGPPTQPDGTVSGATNNCKTTIANASIPAASGWLTTANFGEDSNSIAHGALVAVVMEYASFAGADSIIMSGLTVGGSAASMIQCCNSVNTASWALQTSVVPDIVLGFADGTYGTLDGALPCSAINTTAINNASAARQVGLEITPTFGFSIDSIHGLLQLAANAEMDVNFYTGTALTEVVGGSSPTVDLNTVSTAAAVKWGNFPLSQSRQLTAGTTYRLVFKPTTANNITLYDLSLNAAAHRQCYPHGADAAYVTADSTPTFTNTTTRLPLAIAGICGWDDGKSGMLFNPDLAAT